MSGIDFDGDLDEMLSDDDHGVSVTFGGNTFNGILNKEYYEEEGVENSIATSEPMLYVAESDVPGIEEDNPIVVDSVNYIVGNPEPDGTGMMVIRLNGT